ncbi:XVIPCD domain-containing protein [Dyella sp. 2RAB6]|uniref:XVIPCD domain-containing protein n=1 Tax=Dyella sp. 2RAB6 TaxID=3232992 RepID=UPI003F92F251
MPLSTEAQAVVDAFGHQTGVTSQQLQNLQNTLNGSPALTQEVNDAVAQGHLQRIVPLTNPHAGGEYSPQDKEMRLPLTMLDSPAHGAYKPGEATFVLGHELQHGFNAAEKAQASTRFGQELTAVAQSPDHQHDYTAPIGNLIAASRRDEAGAEISGWNAIVSAAQKDATDHHRAAPTLQDIYKEQPFRMKDFIDVDRSHVPPTYSMKPNLEVDAHLHMATSAKNLEGMGQNYFDRAGGLGHNGNSTYANYYGASAISDAVRFERAYNPPQPGVPAHEMRVDMANLHLSPRIVAENGINLGSNTAPAPYIDRSSGTSVDAQFRHSAGTHTYQPIAPLPSTGEPGVTRLDQAAHPDHGLYRQTLDAVHRLDVQHGRESDVSSNNLAAAVTVQARRDGLNKIDHVVLSEDKSKTFGVQGDLHSPTKQITEVGTAQAVNTSVAQSSQQWQQHRAAQPEQQNQNQQQNQQNQQAQAR